MIFALRRLASGLALAAAPALLCCAACSSSDSHPPALGDCVGSGCTNPGGTSSGSDAAPPDADVLADGDADTDASTTTLSGNITLLADETFEQPQPLLGTGTLHVPTPLGDQVINYGADSSGGYVAENVLVGGNWFSVFPDDELADAGLSVYPTWSLLDVPEGGSDSFDIPVVDRSLISSIYASLDTPTVARTDSAQIVLVFEKAGQRVSGVSITNLPTSEAVAYDVGVGYSTSATATSLGGVAILINTQGAGKLIWTAPGGATGSFTVVYVPGQASFVRVPVE